MLLFVLSALALAGDPTCDRIDWRTETGGAVARADDLPPGLGDRLDELLRDIKREKPGCPGSAPDPACREEGIRTARAATVAYDLLRTRSAEAQAYDDLGTLLGRRRMALSTVSGASLLGEQVRPDARQAMAASAESAMRSIDGLPGQLRMRTEADLAVLDAEQLWLDASRTWNRSRCVGECASHADCIPHKGTLKKLDKLRTLHAQLGEAQRRFLDTYSTDALEQRLAEADASGGSAEILAARAAHIQAILGGTSARPYGARRRLAGVLAAVDGVPQTSVDTRRILIAWVVWAGQWQRFMRGLDKDLDKVTKAYRRVDQARPGTPKELAVSRLRVVLDRLDDGSPGVPGGL